MTQQRIAVACGLCTTDDVFFGSNNWEVTQHQWVAHPEPCSAHPSNGTAAPTATATLHVFGPDSVIELCAHCAGGIVPALMESGASFSIAWHHGLVPPRDWRLSKQPSHDGAEPVEVG